MIGALIALMSIDMTQRLVAGGMAWKSLTISDASNTSPIGLTFTAPHGLTRVAHAVISGVIGNDAANGPWVMTPTGPSTVALSLFTPAGQPYDSQGSGSYVSGGMAQIAFPDGSILLGRRNLAMQMANATPRIVFLPQGCGEWTIGPYGGVQAPQTFPITLSQLTAEQQIESLQRQLNTEPHRFEVHVTGAADPPDPDFADFDVTQMLYQTLYVSLFNMIGPARARVLRGEWTSQRPDMGTLGTRGQKWVGLIEITQPVLDDPLRFIPASTVARFVIGLSGASGDDLVTIVVP